MALTIWDFWNMFWSCFSLKTSHYFCVFSFVGVILWKFSFSAKSTSSVYVVIYIPDEFLWTWKFFHRIFWNLENILNTFIDLISLIFMEIWSTAAKLLPKKPVLLPKIMYEWEEKGDPPSKLKNFGNSKFLLRKTNTNQNV